LDQRKIVSACVDVKVLRDRQRRRLRLDGDGTWQDGGSGSGRRNEVRSQYGRPNKDSSAKRQTEKKTQMPRTPNTWSFEGAHRTLEEIREICPIIGSQKSLLTHLRAGRDTALAVARHEPQAIRSAASRKNPKRFAFNAVGNFEGL
jgi:hypothetical protein